LETSYIIRQDFIEKPSTPTLARWHPGWQGQQAKAGGSAHHGNNPYLQGWQLPFFMVNKADTILMDHADKVKGDNSK
jgi:isocitrate lyase